MKLASWPTGLSTLAPLALAPLALGCIQHRGNGVLLTEDRNTDHALGVSNRTSVPMEVFVEAGSAQQVQLTCDSNLVDLIETRVEDHVLILRTDANVMIDASAGCVAQVLLPELQSLENTGSGGLAAWGSLSGLNLVRSTGSGETSAEGVHSKLLELAHSGSGDVLLEGTAETLVLKQSGSGDAYAADLTSEGLEAKVTGSGDVEATATRWAEVKITGSGDVLLWGSPDELDKDTTGSGDLILR